MVIAAARSERLYEKYFILKKNPFSFPNKSGESILKVGLSENVRWFAIKHNFLKKEYGGISMAAKLNSNNDNYEFLDATEVYRLWCVFSHVVTKPLISSVHKK